MTILAVMAVLILAVSVWFLARPVTRPAGAVSGEEQHELLQQRGRLLTQLSDLDIETADRNMDAAVIGDERQRLEAELAQVLRQLESLIARRGGQRRCIAGAHAPPDAHCTGGVVAGCGHRALCRQAGKNRRATLATWPGRTT